MNNGSKLPFPSNPSYIQHPWVNDYLPQRSKVSRGGIDLGK